MVINGYDFKFAYTVGAYLALGDLNIDLSRPAGKSKYMAQMAVIMSKEYEDKMHLENPEYTPRYLTMAEVRAMKPKDFPKLSAEVDEAFRVGNEITVETEPAKKNAGAAER